MSVIVAIGSLVAANAKKQKLKTKKGAKMFDCVTKCDLTNGLNKCPECEANGSKFKFCNDHYCNECDRCLLHCGCGKNES